MDLDRLEKEFRDFKKRVEPLLAKYEADTRINDLQKPTDAPIDVASAEAS